MLEDVGEVSISLKECTYNAILYMSRENGSDMWFPHSTWTHLRRLWCSSVGQRTEQWLWLSRQGDIPSTVTQHDRTAFTCAAPRRQSQIWQHDITDDATGHTTHPKRRRWLPHLPTTPLPRQTIALSLIRQYKMIFLLFLRCCYDFLSVYAFVTKYLFTYYPRQQSFS